MSIPNVFSDMTALGVGFGLPILAAVLVTLIFFGLWELAQKAGFSPHFGRRNLTEPEKELQRQEQYISRLGLGLCKYRNMIRDHRTGYRPKTVFAILMYRKFLLRTCDAARRAGASQLIVDSVETAVRGESL